MLSETAIPMKRELRLSKETMCNVFDSGVYINCLQTFYAYFGSIPSYKSIRNIDHKKAISWIESTQKENIVQTHRKEYYSVDTRKMECENVLYILNDDIVIDIEDNGVVCILYKTKLESRACEFAEKVKSFKNRRRIEPKISIITNSSHGLSLTRIKCPKPKLQIDSNYNDDLVALHKDLVRNLSRKDKSGLYLFHGLPGTGKSTYIRFLIGSINKQFIFLSPKIAANLDTPNFINLLIENRNSVLIIEDAEELLISRENNVNSAISVLLNLTDGILGESLGIQSICTFNTKSSNIDEALTRKGRLTAMYEFRELNTEKANNLLKKLGDNHSTVKPMPLSDIYNTDKPRFAIAADRKQIGFKVA